MNRNVCRITFLAVIGGFIFGLNMAGISGAVNSIRDLFDLSDGGIGLVVSALTIGCLAGALFTGALADRFGRRKVFLIVALLFIVSAAGCALSTDPLLLAGFRVLAGLAVGADSVVGPMYLSEIAPAARRGRLVSCQQFAITIGILAAYGIDFMLLPLADSWRWMLAVPAFFGVAFFVLICLFLPESPRWNPAGKQTAAGGGVGSAALFRGRMGYVVALGTVLAAMQQITGINAVINYAPIIFQKTGVGGSTALLQASLVGAVNLLATVVAIGLVDRVGRRTLLVWGAAGMVASLGYLTASFAFGWAEAGILIGVLAYIAFFAASFAPVMWVVISEIYPDRIRAKAMSFSTAVSWVCTFLTVQFSPWILGQLGAAVLFGTFGLLSLAALVFVLRCIPETKGRSLDGIEQELGLSKRAR